MAKPICFIISHGGLAKPLADVAFKFFEENLPLHCYSNQQLDLQDIVSEITDKMKQVPDRKPYIFVDLMGGSCWQAAMRIKKEFREAVIITGINVPVIISFAANYKRLNEDDLLKKLEEDAKKGIRIFS